MGKHRLSDGDARNVVILYGSTEGKQIMMMMMKSVDVTEM